MGTSLVIFKTFKYSSIYSYITLIQWSKPMFIEMLAEEINNFKYFDCYAWTVYNSFYILCKSKTHSERTTSRFWQWLKCNAWYIHTRINDTWMFLYCQIIMIVTLYSYVPPEYGSYKYPPWAQVFGWFVAVIPLIPIPVFAYREIKNANGRTYMEVSWQITTLYTL